MSTDAAKKDSAHAPAEQPRPVPGPDQGYLSEMFCSVQGEGPFVGERQIFLRTAGCAATCSWCDTVYSKVQTPRFVIHEEGKRALPNPVGVAPVVAEVVSFAGAQGGVSTVSITGGEPLEQPEFVAAVAASLRTAGLGVYLETAGLHAEAFAKVLPHVDVVAMDIKLPSAIGSEAWEAHRSFLSTIRGTSLDPDTGGGRTIFVKVVVDRVSTIEEIMCAARIVAGASPKIPLILQPESGTLLSDRAPREEATRVLALLRRAQRDALDILEEVRVMPQCHKILGIR